MKAAVLLLVIGCASPQLGGDPPAFPFREASDSLIRQGLRLANLVVLATPDSMVVEPGVMTPSIRIGASDSWWNVRLTVDSVAKGRLGLAKWLDYGDLPRWMQPTVPFRLVRNQIIVQQGGRWRTAPLVLGVKGVYFLRKCYNCVALPDRTQYRVYASPWFAILALTANQWDRVRTLH